MIIIIIIKMIINDDYYYYIIPDYDYNIEIVYVIKNVSDEIG